MKQILSLANSRTLNSCILARMVTVVFFCPACRDTSTQYLSLLWVRFMRKEKNLDMKFFAISMGLKCEWFVVLNKMTMVILDV